MARMFKCKLCGEESVYGTQRLHYLAKHPDKIKHKPRKKGTKLTVTHRNGNGHHVETTDDVINLDFPLGYAVGRIEAQLESYAGRIRVAPPAFTSRVARLLLRSARGQ